LSHNFASLGKSMISMTYAIISYNAHFMRF
jgi:hypothetical protein